MAFQWWKPSNASQTVEILVQTIQTLILSYFSPNICHDELRKQKRLHSHHIFSDLPPEDINIDHQHAETILLDKLHRASVAPLLEQLPHSMQVVLHLHYFEEMTFKEVSQTLQCSENAVKLRACRAYALLRKLLAAGGKSS